MKITVTAAATASLLALCAPGSAQSYDNSLTRQDVDATTRAGTPGRSGSFSGVDPAGGSASRTTFPPYGEEPGASHRELGR